MGKKILFCDCEVIHQDIVKRVARIMPKKGKCQKLAGFYKIFSDSTRIRILWAISQEEMCVCDIAVLLGMTKSAISHQLRTLRLGGLIKYEKHGREVFYSLDCNDVKDVIFTGLKYINKRARK